MTNESDEFATLAKWWEGQAEQATVPQIRHHAERMVRACQLAHERLRFTQPEGEATKLPYAFPLKIMEEGGDRWIQDADGVPIPPTELIEALNLLFASSTPQIQPEGGKP